MAIRVKKFRSRSRNIVGSLALAALLVATRPAILAKVYALSFTYDWVRQNEYLDINSDGWWWNDVVRSADDSVLLSTASLGNEYPLSISRNNGTSWQNIAADVDPNISHSWNAVDVSNNGDVLVVASNVGWDPNILDYVPGKVFVSEDSGSTWIDITPGGGSLSHWQHVVVSGNGQRIIALSYDDRSNVYITDDVGNNWQAVPVNDVWQMNDWDTLAVSDDGSKILFGGESWETATTQLYFSDNDGSTWENVSPDLGVNAELVHAAIDATGSKIAVSMQGSGVGGNVNKVFISENDGADWTDITPDPEINAGWQYLALSDDGSVVTVANSGNSNLYFAHTSDMVWDVVSPGVAFADDIIFWASIDLNSDGSGFIGNGGEEVYTSFVDNSSTVANFNNAEDAKAVVLTLPSGTTVTCQSAVKESGVTTQDVGYQYPVGLVDFCFSTNSESNAVSLLFVTDLKPSQIVVRKYNSNTQTYSTLDGVSITETTNEGNAALLITYTIVDNGPLDLDPDVGEIADPVGIASPIGVPNTGLLNVIDRLKIDYKDNSK